jgi:hypothetical protein
MKTNFRKVGRRFKNTMKKTGTIIRKGAGVVRGIVGTVDKLTGGQLSKMITSDPRGMMLMAGVNSLADRDKKIRNREQRKIL